MKVIEQVILASQSKIRKEIMSSLALPFSVLPSRVDESQITADTAQELSLRRASKKAEDVAKRSSLALVIGCDQVLSFENTVFSKPKDELEAFKHLKALEGKEHTLFSAVSIYKSGMENERGTELSKWISAASMKMLPLKDDEIREYVATGEWKGSVGAYKIEGLGSSLLKPQAENFDQTIIMGLPVRELIKRLEEFGCCFSVEKKLPFELKQ